MQRVKITFAYKGTHFHGWQKQKNCTTVQSEMENTLAKLYQTPLSLVGSGRTDTGVHALEQVAHADIPQGNTIKDLKHSLNALLRGDIRIKSVENVSRDFHARYSAKGKKYQYLIHLSPLPCPFHEQLTFRENTPLNLHAMRAFALQLQGTHDFTSFSNSPNEGAVARNPVRTLYHIDFLLQGNLLCIEYYGNGFLYKMCRNLTGILIEVGKGNLSLDEAKYIFKQKDRRLAPPPAKPHGLYLKKVFYEE